MKSVKPKTVPVFRLTQPWQARFNFTAKDVVELFLNTNSHWFSDKSNSLHGKRAAARRVLMKHLVHGEDIATGDLIYVLNKFQKEWMEDNAIFGRVSP